jgi:hypothetical protein
VLLPRVALGKRGAVAVDQVAVQIKGVSRERCAVHAGRNDSLVAGWRLASLRQAANDARAQHTPPDGATDHRGTKVPRGPAASRGVIAVMRAATRTSGSRASICRASTPRRSSARSTDAQRQRCRRRRRFRIGSDRFGGHGNEHFVHAKAEARATRRKAPARRPQRAWRARAPCSSVDRSMAALVHRGREELSAHG